MEIPYGKTGWLTPEGIFHECNYGQHRILARVFMQDEELRAKQVFARNEDSLQQFDEEFLRRSLSYIPMGTQLGGWDAYLHFNIDKKIYEAIVTDSQIDWFKENYKFLHIKQKEQVQNWLDEKGINWDELEGVV